MKTMTTLPTSPHQLDIFTREDDVSLESVLGDARFHAAGEPRTIFPIRVYSNEDPVAVIAGVCICPAGEPVFYLTHVDLARMLDRFHVSPVHRWRLNGMLQSELDALRTIADAIPEAPPVDVYARRAWGIVNTVRERLGMPEPRPCSAPPIVPLVDIPVGRVDGKVVAPSPGVPAEPISLVGFVDEGGDAGVQVRLYGQWSFVKQPPPSTLVEVVETELARLETFVPGGANGVVIQVVRGPSMVEMRWMKKMNEPHTRIWIA